MGSADFFQISTGSTEPIYRQLIEQVRRRIAGGQLKAGEAIPSVRELAEALAVNPMTISKAFSQLEAEGLLERRPGLPMVVAQQHRRALSAAERLALLRPTLERAAAEARELELPEDTVLTLLKTLLREAQ
jgi:GntR family transcriptional regulator